MGIPSKKGKTTNTKSIKFIIDDKTCIGCGMCTVLYSQGISYNNDTNIPQIIKQPTLQEETTQMQQALESCPASSIKKVK